MKTENPKPGSKSATRKRSKPLSPHPFTGEEALQSTLAADLMPGKQKKEQEMTIFESGPFLVAALFCDYFLHDQDGTDSYIRIIDRVTFPKPADSENSPPETRFTLVISFKAGGARGSYELSVQTRLPDGLSLPARKGTILFEDEDRGETITVPVHLQAHRSGVYWFEIRLNGELVTKVPFRVIFR